MKPAPDLKAQKDDIQAMLGKGFGSLPNSRFWLLTIQDVVLAKAWLAQRDLSEVVMSIEAVDKYKKDNNNDTVKEVAAIAFSYEGLLKLGLMESTNSPFPTPFRSGMGSDLRERLLRDDPREGWLWGDNSTDTEVMRPVAHILLASWWDTTTTPRLPRPCSNAFTMQIIEGCPSFFHKGEDNDKGYWTEPFGFRDGISQPEILGLKDENHNPSNGQNSAAETEGDRDHRIAAGEFILGYRNEYDELSYCADVQGWKEKGDSAHPGARFTLNGSYLAVRQIEQDVDEFAKLDGLSLGASVCPAGITLAEKMIGRRRDGSPLNWRGPGPAITGADLNSFRFRAEDENGFLTPRGSHIRRANPRDTLAHDVLSGILSSKLHRLLRRGRPYRIRNTDGTTTVGTFFIACNADIERQFEFVYQRWLRNPRFADLDHEDDPVVGRFSNEKKFSMPALPLGESETFKSFKPFTQTLGGGYFFLPGLKALKFILGQPG